MGEGSSRRNKKRKRGTSLIFKSCFLLPGSGNDHEEKVLASDDNLVYCDLTNTGTHGDSSSVRTKSTSSRGRMSSIFKAVLFDTAMKKKIRGKRSSKTANESTNSSLVPSETTNSLLVPNETIENLPDKNDLNDVKVSEASNDSSNVSRNVVLLPPVKGVSLVASSSDNNGSQTLTEKKVKSQVDSSRVNTDSQMLTGRKVTSPVTSSSVNADSQMLTKGKVTSLDSQMLTERKVMSPVASSSVNTDSQMLTEGKVTSPVASSLVNTNPHMLTEEKIASSVNTDSPMLTNGNITSPVPSSTINNGSQMMTKSKVMSRVNSNKKPPLPSVSRSPAESSPEKDCKRGTFNNSVSSLCMFIVLAGLVLVVLWMSLTTPATKSLVLKPDHYTNVAVVEDEL